MTDFERTMLLEVVMRLMHQYELQYQESLQFIRKYGNPFASDYAAVAAALSRLEACREILSQISLWLDTLPPSN